MVLLCIHHTAMYHLEALRMIPGMVPVPPESTKELTPADSYATKYGTNKNKGL